MDWLETETGLLVPASLAEEIQPALVPIGIDLFAGCGGFSCGFVQAGFHVIGASEWDFAATETYLANLGGPKTIMHFGATPPPKATRKEKALYEKYAGKPVEAGEIFESAGTGWIAEPARDRDDDHKHKLPCEHFWFCNVMELTGGRMLSDLGMERGDVDVIMGGPPCQGFSLASKNRGPNNPLNNLVFEFARLVCEIQPKTMCMENVPQIANMTTPEGIPVIDALCKILETGNYGEFEALRKALVSHPDARVAYKGAKSQRKQAADEPEIDEEEQQELAL